MTDDIPIIDQGVLDELRASVAGDEAFVRELVAAYLAEAPNELAQIAAASAAGDAAAIVRPAHTLKSSSAALGAMRLSAMCREIEHAGRSGRAAGTDEVELARSTWQATLDALTSAGLTP